MKRPLIVLAAGFVLGEVLALQDNRAVFAWFWWLLCAAAGLSGVCIMGSVIWDSRLKHQGSGAGKKALLLFFVLTLIGGGTGYARGRWEKERLDGEETLAQEFEDGRMEISGNVQSVENGDGSISLMLEEVEGRAGRKTGEWGKVWVYLKEERTENEETVDGMTEAGSGALEDGFRYLLPGMSVMVKGKLEVIEGPRNPGEFDFRKYYRSKGTVCRMFGDSAEILDPAVIPYRTFLMKFRSRCAGILDRICLPEDSQIFKAVLLGDTSGMDQEVRTMYQRHGISHLLAVSGQHLAVIGGGIYLVLRRMGLGYNKSGILGAALVISYGIMTGSSGSAIRAVIMILCLWLAASRGRSYDTMSAVGLAAVLLLWKAPYLLFQSGFQLSFGAVMAIGSLGKWLGEELGIRKGWQNTVLMSLCVQIVITPVVLFHYYQHPLYGIFLNLLVIPLISVLMYSGLLGIAIGNFWTKGGMMAVGAGHYVLCFYEALCRQVERLPGYCLVMGRPSWVQIGIYGSGIAGALCGLVYLIGRWRPGWKPGWKSGWKSGWRPGWRLGWKPGWRPGRRNSEGCTQCGSKVKQVNSASYKMGRRLFGENLLNQWRESFEQKNAGKESRERRNGNGRLIAIVFCIYSMCFSVLLPWHKTGLEVIMMDVGQGDGILMRSGRYTVLIDGGSSSEKSLGNKTLEPCLKSKGISTLDYAVVSHGDNDHISGILYLLESSKDITVKNLILPAPGRGQEIYDRLEHAAEAAGGSVSYMSPADHIQAGNISLTCLYAGGDTAAPEDRNAHSLVICADYKGFHMLFTGDMGTEQERGLLELAKEDGTAQKEHLDHVQILKAAHHGSHTSTSQAFLNRLTPGLVLVSYGRGNSYGHPSPDVMERIKKGRIPVMETGTGGAVILWTDGQNLHCRYFLPIGQDGF